MLFVFLLSLREFSPTPGLCRSVLPVQCLCEFLLTQTVGSVDDLGAGRPPAPARHHQLLSHLQRLVRHPGHDQRANFELVEYFLRRLSSQQRQARLQAAKVPRALAAHSFCWSVSQDTERASCRSGYSFIVGSGGPSGGLLMQELKLALLPSSGLSRLREMYAPCGLLWLIVTYCGVR